MATAAKRARLTGLRLSSIDCDEEVKKRLLLRCSEAAETIECLYLMWVQGQRQVVCNQCPRVASQGRPEALKPVDSEPALAGLQIADLLVGRVDERC